MTPILLVAALALSADAQARVPWGDRDRDGDGLSNGLERSIGSDPRAADTDGDGWTDWEEYVYVGRHAGTNARNTPDDDCDGLYDVYEAAFGTSDRSDDTDGDGWTDWEEYVYGSDGTDPASVP